MYYSCEQCNKSFTRSDNLRRHQRQSCCHNDESVPTEAKRSRVEEEEPSTSNNQWKCNCCNITIPANCGYSHRRTLQHRTNMSIAMGDGIKRIDSAFKSRIVSYRIESKNEHIDFNEFFEEIKSKLLVLLERMLALHRSIKVNVEAFGLYYLHTQEVRDMKNFNTPNQMIEESMDLNAVIDLFRDTIAAQAQDFQERDSGK